MILALRKGDVNIRKLIIYWIVYGKFSLLDYFWGFLIGYWLFKLTFFSYLYRLLHHLSIEFETPLKILDEKQVQKRHTCPICLEELDIYTNGISYEDDHVYCSQCIEKHIESNVSELPLSADSDGIKCPQPGCDRKMLHATLRQIIGEVSLKRLDERILEQNLAPFNDIESTLKEEGPKITCKMCNFAMQIDMDKQRMQFFTCLACGAFFCRTCKRDAKPGHIGKTCEEIDRREANENDARKIENEMCEAVIRRCPNCALPFLKQDGCNKMTCRCGTTQCYICRTPNITYDHFCGHDRNPNVPCFRCDKQCLLWQDAEEEDEQMLRNLRRRIL